MGIFDNCRICLREINHEPIKMTRLILGFLEKSLQLANVTKPNPQDNAKRNLCAPCFNKISDFQDFLELCKDSDEFWKAQFEDLTEFNLRKQSNCEETLLITSAEESNSLEADTTVSTTEVKNEIYNNRVEERDYERAIDLEMEQNMQVNEENNFSPSSSQMTEDEKETVQMEKFNNVDLQNWQDDTNDETGEIQTSECNDNTSQLTQELIEYEYQIEEDEDVEIAEFQMIDETATSASCGVDYRSFEYVKFETGDSSENDVIGETKGEIAGEHTETTQNNFFLTTSVDENGKMKMNYKCSECDKTFNRIYDIESHYNIHSGIKPFTCNVCGKSFRQKNILTTHQALHFGKKVECAECGKKFARRSQLILHYRMHRDEKPFVCDMEGCQAAFRQRKQLVDHSFIHTGEKNFQCARCTKSFHTRKRLQDHIYKVHSQYRYRCELCEKAFLKPHMLKHHMITAHNVEIDDVSHLKTLIDSVKPIKKRV